MTNFSILSYSSTREISTGNDAEGDSVAEWSARRTRNPAVLGSSPALATSWICSRSYRVQILGLACKYPTGCLLPGGFFNPVKLYLSYLFLSI